MKGFFGRIKNTVAGNARRYSVTATAADATSPLKSKRIIFLGSSVTYGAAACGESFADFLAKKDGVEAVKEAVSGTTLCDTDKTSYISRMKTLDPGIKADAFFCQLSTNDAGQKLPLGKIAEGYEEDLFDTATVAGAVEYIITYAKRVWKCPVFFYTGTKFESPGYAAMVLLLNDIAAKHDIKVLDLWNSGINGIAEKKYRLYMADGIHPTRAGYREWWLPEFEKFLNENL